MKRAMWILWPSFLVGGAAEAVFFTLFDPMDMHLFGNAIDVSREIPLQNSCIDL